LALPVRAAAAALAAIEAFEAGETPPALVELAETLVAEAGLPDFDRLVAGLVLAPSEVALVLLLLAHATNEGVARRTGAALSPPAGQGLPLWLAMRLVPGLAVEQLSAARALRRFGVVEFESTALRVDAQLRLAEPVLDRLLGCPVRDAELAPRIRPMVPAGKTAASAADPVIGIELAAAFTHRDGGGLSQVAIFPDADPGAVAACLASMGLRAWLLDAGAIPADAAAAEKLALHWSREAMLDPAALVVMADEAEAGRAADFAARVLGHVVLIGPVRAAALLRGARVVPARAPSPQVLAGRWAAALGEARAERLGRYLARIAAQFRLDPAEIEAVAADVDSSLDSAPDAKTAAERLWHAASRAGQAIAVPGVTMVEPVFTWDDIVLAPDVERALRRLESHVRHATTVMDDWGFARRIGGRGRGVVALLSGPSGTGKTMAAEVLASSLDLRMMVIDLSQVISKWIGETSKNIAACFRQAERSGAVMVWNEGDAIWGARGTVGSATDRHVNSEIGDLLQRMESFDGFSVVTTHMRHAVDTAFLRRFRFMIELPMPTEVERLRIWQKAFPAEAPIETVDWATLAALPLSGGSIRNVALGSAFHVAERGGRIDAQAIVAELAEELRKQDLPMPVLDWGTRQ
jgi:hypothetical protein